MFSLSLSPKNKKFWLDLRAGRWGLRHGDVPVKVVEEGQQVEGQLAPALLLTVGQDVCVHDGGGVVESRAAHHGSAHVPAEKPRAVAGLRGGGASGRTS